MISLFRAIMDNYTGGHALYLHESPAEKDPPYIVYQHIIGTHKYTFDTVKEEVTLQFNCFSAEVSAVACCTMAEEIKTLYDDCRLAVAGYRVVTCEREFCRLLGGPGDWQYSIQYNIKLEEV